MDQTAYRHYLPPQTEEEMEDRFAAVHSLKENLALALAVTYGHDDDFAERAKQAAEYIVIAAEAYRRAMKRMRHQYEAEQVIPELLAPFFKRKKPD